MNKKILVLLATGFEDTELVSTINVFKRSNLSYELFSVENKEIVEGQNKTLVKPTFFDDSLLENFDAIFLPGGSGHKVLLENDLVISLVKKYDEAKKLVSSICAAPEVLKKAGILENKTFTSYPGFAISSKNTGKAVEIHENVITARDFKASIEFAEKIVDYLAKN